MNDWKRNLHVLKLCYEVSGERKMKPIVYKLPDGMRGQRVLIPLSQRLRPIKHLGASTRLLNILEQRGLQWIGQLNGITYQDFLMFRNAGEKTALELREIVERLQSTPDASWPVDPARPIKSVIIHIPAAARAIRMVDLSMPRRLASVLARAGIETLGDLDGLDFMRMNRFAGYGPVRMRELVEVLRNAGIDEVAVALNAAEREKQSLQSSS